MKLEISSLILSKKIVFVNDLFASENECLQSMLERKEKEISQKMAKTKNQ